MELEQRNLGIEELESETGHEVTEPVARQKNQVQQSLFWLLETHISHGQTKRNRTTNPSVCTKETNWRKHHGTRNFHIAMFLTALLAWPKLQFKYEENHSNPGNWQIQEHCINLLISSQSLNLQIVLPGALRLTLEVNYSTNVTGFESENHHGTGNFHIVISPRIYDKLWFRPHDAVNLLEWIF